jgi:hypothetical protein
LPVAKPEVPILCTQKEKIFIMDKDKNGDNTFKEKHAGCWLTALNAGR